MRLLLLVVFVALGSGAAAAQAQRDAVPVRELDRINWMEFKEVVPSRVQTVLLPTGTLEPHGVINNGADNTAPAAIARRIAPRVNAMIAPTLPYGITGSLSTILGPPRSRTGPPGSDRKS